MNKKASWIITILCVGLQTHNFGAEKTQGWWDWFYSKLTGSKVVSVATEKATQKAISKGIKLAVQYSGMEPRIIMDIFDLFWALLDDIQPIVSSYRTDSIDKDEAIQKIKADLLVLINNQLLYPTRSSKINALLKKDEFLQYVNDQNDLVQDACNQLIGEINALEYSPSKKAVDEAVDTKMATIRGMIIRGQSLTEQIKELEATIDQKQHFDIPEMQAYLSLYFRLKNKQNVEGKLTKEEKESRQSLAKEAAQAEEYLKSEKHHRKLEEFVKQRSEKKALEKLQSEGL